MNIPRPRQEACRHRCRSSWNPGRERPSYIGKDYVSKKYEGEGLFAMDIPWMRQVVFRNTRRSSWYPGRERPSETRKEEQQQDGGMDEK